MATFERRAGRWRARVRRAGGEVSQTFDTKAQAQAWALSAERTLRAQAAGEVEGGRTLREALVRYAQEVSPKKPGARWEALRLARFARTMPFADRALDAVGAPLLAQWRDARLAEVAPASVARELALLGAVLACARREWRWMAGDPLRDVRTPSRTPHRTRRVSAEEIERLCVALGFDDARPVVERRQEVAVAFLFAIETAMRAGELLGLTRADVRGRVAHLARTKTGRARDVPLSRRALELLAMLPGGEGGRYFRLTPGTCDTLFRRARDAAGIRDLHFHDSRREATSRLAAKLDVMTLARVTGHADLRMLMVYYQTGMDEVAERLG